MWLNVTLESFQVEGMARTTSADQCAAKYRTYINISPLLKASYYTIRLSLACERFCIYIYFLMLFAVEKKDCIFFSLCYNKLWQHYRDSFITSAVNVANVQTDGRKTVFFSSFRQYGSSFTSQETWLQVLQLKWNGGEKTGKTKRRENISCLTMPHLAARFCPLESVSDSLARNMAGQQLVGVHFVALMVLIMSFLTQRSTYGQPALGVVVIPLTSSPPCSTDDLQWRDQASANEQSCGEASCYPAEQN